MRIDSDGWHIRQSDLKNLCLEKLRLEVVNPDLRVENDAATVGTAFHHVIEHEMDGNWFSTEKDIRYFAAQKYVAMLADYEQTGTPYVLSSFGNNDKAIDLLANLASSWYGSHERDYLMHNSEAISEWNFDRHFCDVSVKKNGKKGEVIPVYLSGTADIVLPHSVWDWKTAASDYKGWEKQRWDRQSDVYTWAAADAGLLQAGRDNVYDFQFIVFKRGVVNTSPQIVPVSRSENNWRALQDIVERFVNFAYNMGWDTEWPTNDQHVLCSPKWCPAWSSCKGRFVDDQRWL